MEGEILMVCKCTERSRPSDQQLILGVASEDIAALRDCIVTNGGKLAGQVPPKDESETNARYCQ